MLISKSEIKLITSLQQKKYRNKHGLFIAEGKKIISDLISGGVKLHSLFATEDKSEISESFQTISEDELNKISALKNANGVLAVFEIPSETTIKTEGLQLVLDSVRDPGNLGTIIRLCDWFGVSQLICSLDTVDCYNPKVVQATMGSIARVSVLYTDLKPILKEIELPIYTAVMDGSDVYSEVLPKNALLVMGNEANGVSEEILQLAKYRITIPNFSKNNAAESLNVATATGILLSEFRRTTET
ncbi:MAG TPA: RNA methyltransferase [Flavobacteriaceae bacterium]|nr:RNA methyltransferase [Flavobacteriaceae bacterium]HAT64008.1 RNA methyltransferase [Flavobacteriaceae bacterium]